MCLSGPPCSEDGYGSWLAGLRPWDIFGTYTFDPKKITLPGGPWEVIYLEGVKDIILRFHNFTARLLGRETAGIYVIEPHESEAPHIHFLSDCRGIEADEAEEMESAWVSRYGIASVEPVVDVEHAAAYVAKGLATFRSDMVITREIGQLPKTKLVGASPLSVVSLQSLTRDD